MIGTRLVIFDITRDDVVEDDDEPPPMPSMEDDASIAPGSKIAVMQWLWYHETKLKLTGGGCCKDAMEEEEEEERWQEEMRAAYHTTDL